ncbi:TetR family transcriptional regulator [Paenibacillus sp. N3.4]|uniref:TetR family transcriptional regulator n=1 Tax=Paenibacillus sp. N3.4 TaxID=2603222 RepID=UPI0011CAFF16|nr:TetR family transcriptional regulator [Paenibacillus sp. N3.4]TXK80624.1 TetR/AcrR family transcriptional regulator [Paenibacillus sp. N3.4]
MMSPKVSDEHKEQRRRQLLDAAERVFIRKGYESATMKDFVEEAEMSRGWIYLYFSSKEEIFAAIVERMDADNTKQVENQLAQSSSMWETVAALLDQQKEDLAESSSSMASVMYEYFISGWRSEERKAQLAGRYASGFGIFTTLIEKGIERGEFKPTLSVPLIAKIIAAQLDGILTHTLAVGHEQAEVENQIDALIAYSKQLLGVVHP